MKKILSILFIIMLIITFLQITMAYALYRDELSGDFSTRLGKWAVKVNGTDIVKEDGQVTTFEMSQNDIHYMETEYVAPEIGIAPDSTGYFYIELDSTETELAVKYSIQIGEVSEYRMCPLDYNPDTDEKPEAHRFTTPFTFQVEGVEDAFMDKNGFELSGATYRTHNKVELETNSVKGILPLNKRDSVGCRNKVKVTFRWVNDDENTSLQDALTLHQKEHNDFDEMRLIIPVKVSLYQYLGGLL